MTLLPLLASTLGRQVGSHVVETAVLPPSLERRSAEWSRSGSFGHSRAPADLHGVVKLVVFTAGDRPRVCPSEEEPSADQRLGPAGGVFDGRSKGRIPWPGGCVTEVGLVVEATAEALEVFTPHAVFRPIDFGLYIYM